MRLTHLVAVALPAVALAAKQPSLQDKVVDWFERVQAFGKAIVQSSVDAGAAKVAGANVHYLTAENWKSTLQHSGANRPYDPPEAWMVLVTGGNKTCRGHCDRLNRAWNESAAYFAADPGAPRLAVVDCDKHEVVCGAWVALPSTIWFFLVPQPGPDQSRARTVLTIHELNATTVTSSDITRIHTRQEYLRATPYEGVMHPFDGIIARLGLTMPLAYFLYAISLVPSWAIMIGLSLFSRHMVQKRIASRAPQQGQAAPAAAAPAAAPPKAR